MNGALAGVRVLDFSEYIAGPYGGELLADLGAEVIKVEPPHGDFWRLSNPIAKDESRGFIGVNKGKLSISVDLKHPDGLAVVHKAVTQSDVVLANYRPGVAERLGVDYATLSKLNPRLIYAEISAYGNVGPFAGKAGFDLTAQALTGIMAYEGGTGLPRPITATSLTDLTSGMFLALAICSALYQREHTGRGQQIETSLYNAGLAIQYRPLLSIEAVDREMREQLLAAIEAGRAAGKPYDEVLAEFRRQHPPPPTGGAGPYFKTYETLDAYVTVGCLNNRLRRQVAEEVGVDDPRVQSDVFDQSLLSPEATVALTEEMEAIFRTRTTAEWVAAFEARGVPSTPVRATAEIFEDAQAVATNMIVELDHPVVGKIKMANSPVRMSGADTGSQLAAPALGQHTREVLGRLGYTDAEIHRLEASKAIRSWQPQTDS